VRPPDAQDLSDDALIVTAQRSFRCPTGLRIGQDILFCFRPAGEGVQLSIGGKQLPLVVQKGLAVASITDIIEGSNRVEIRWRIDQVNQPETGGPEIPERFEAWLEISESTVT
jgi:hypothetical protein